MSEEKKQENAEKITAVKGETGTLKKKLRAQHGFMEVLDDNRAYLLLFAAIVATLAVILISILGLKISVVPVCIVVLIEIGMAVCLQEVPIWLHALVVIAEVAAGIFFEKTVFMILCAALYVVGILVLKFLRD